MITALTWVPRGAARLKPVRFELSQEEYSRIKSLAKVEEQIEKEANENDVGEGDDPDFVPSGATFRDDVQISEENDEEVELPAELRMDEYDDDSEHEDNEDEDNNFAVSLLLIPQDKFLTHQSNTDLVIDSNLQDVSFRHQQIFKLIILRSCMHWNTSRCLSKGIWHSRLMVMKKTRMLRMMKSELQILC